MLHPAVTVCNCESVQQGIAENEHACSSNLHTQKIEVQVQHNFRLKHFFYKSMLRVLIDFKTKYIAHQTEGEVEFS